MVQVNTIFDFNVSYNTDDYTVEDIKNILIKHTLDYFFEISIEEVETYKIEENNTWIDKHSVNCIRCGVLFDEREGITPDNGEGTLCPQCVKEDK